MARNLARIPLIEEAIDDPVLLVDTINERLGEANRVLLEVEAELNQQKGNDGAVPIFNNEPDLRVHRITNGQRSKDPRDFVIRQELIDLGLLGDASGKIIFGGEVEFASQVTVSGPTGGSGGIVTGGDLAGAISLALGSTVATNNAGDVLENEQDDGTNGGTPGTVAMGRDGDGKARYLTMVGDRLQVDNGSVEELLILLIEEIRGLRDELRG